jgi:hypothetical protein
MGRAALPHAVPDDQHGVRSHHCLGFDVLSTGLNLAMNGQIVWNYT